MMNVSAISKSNQFSHNISWNIALNQLFMVSELADGPVLTGERFWSRFHLNEVNLLTVL